MPRRLQKEIITFQIDQDEVALLFRAKIRDIQRLTGLLFFPDLTPRARLELTTREYSRLWSFKYQGKGGESN